MHSAEISEASLTNGDRGVTRWCATLTLTFISGRSFFGILIPGMGSGGGAGIVVDSVSSRGSIDASAVV